VSNLKRRQWLLFAYWVGFQALFCQNAPPLLAKANACPEDVETLTALLIRDVPSYANRVMQRSRRLSRRDQGFSYVLLAGRPEFTPLPVSPSSYLITPTIDKSPPKQVFFTTLERQYISGKALESQLFHWLFLTKTDGGWRLALMFTQFGSSVRGRPPTPPQESSNGVVGQAVTTWLRDCRAGVIKTGSRRS
jgi:hypothetical protein